MCSKQNKFNMIKGINELKTLTKHISCEYICKFDGRKCNSNQWWNNDKCRCECKKHVCEENYIWNPVTCSCKNGKYWQFGDYMWKILMKKLEPIKYKISIFYSPFY